MREDVPTASRISDPGIRALYALPNRWQAWLDVEVALARAQAEIGMIPAEAPDAIAAKARVELIDPKLLEEGFERTGHTIVPLVWELSRLVGEPYGRLDPLGRHHPEHRRERRSPRHRQGA